MTRGTRITTWTTLVSMFLDIEPHPEGLPQKEWNKHLDAYLLVNELNPDIVPFLNDWQMLVINEIKKSIKRIDKKYESERQSGKHQG